MPRPSTSVCKRRDGRAKIATGVGVIAPQDPSGQMGAPRGAYEDGLRIDSAVLQRFARAPSPGGKFDAPSLDGFCDGGLFAREQRTHKR